MTFVLFIRGIIATEYSFWACLSGAFKELKRKQTKMLHKCADTICSGINTTKLAIKTTLFTKEP